MTQISLHRTYHKGVGVKLEVRGYQTSPVGSLAHYDGCFPPASSLLPERRSVGSGRPRQHNATVARAWQGAVVDQGSGQDADPYGKQQVAQRPAGE